VVKAAVFPVRVTVASVVAPSLKVTLPVGVPAPGATVVTVAVKVSDWPKTDGLGPVVRAIAVVVLAWFTVCVTVLEVLAPKVLATPAYDAVRLCGLPATVRVETESVAVPLTSVGVPNVVAPSLNVTVPPVGTVVPAVWATIAVSVVDCPNTVGLTELVSVVEVGSTTLRVPVPVAVPAWQVPPPFAASTVNVVEPGGVAIVVEIVRVEVGSVFVTDVGLNDAVAPVGKAVVMLNGDVQALPLPLKPTVTVYTALPIGATGLGD
jgi:hypothetical protein